MLPCGELSSLCCLDSVAASPGPSSLPWTGHCLVCCWLLLYSVTAYSAIFSQHFGCPLSKHASAQATPVHCRRFKAGENTCTALQLAIESSDVFDFGRETQTINFINCVYVMVLPCPSVLFLLSLQDYKTSMTQHSRVTKTLQLICRFVK